MTGTGATATDRRLVVAAAIWDSLERPSAMLCAQRSAPPELAGRWELPGGKVEPDEAPEAALHRELAEELGIKVRLGPVVPTAEGADWPILHHLRMRVWLAEVTSGVAEALQDHAELRWVARDELDDLDWLDPDRPILRALRAATR
ncbi:(deoxy)nucleoside triphosphate pyrophosphohydrolase [Georgenia subflava]|uniref:8-oxo-dGTP diphosphatase n=1 Tax=Georgenia subflava TaxID=1622177 RepID=A0A6N7EIU4_9MICO|nr:NUDIX domain-containing protein [Georgenia subflava]MPV38302.1 NUDIX domain-containing protein [Georgenia subflava]